MNAPYILDGKIVVEFATTKRNPQSPWPVLTGTVTPATRAETRGHDARVKLATRKLELAQDAAAIDAAAAEQVMLQARFYAAHIKSWSLELPISPEAVAALPDEIFDQLDAIVTGNAGLILGN